ncbi:tetratricopeptide repeat protein [Bacillus sp. FJAT-45037]|uniref:tetratricopeptide repeat protein n=1 Tax=Bacillus sp. FJAT-45037 TaxID=2011007 RepID=UPI000C234809|nr:tetratricopeptide repeat protein [Bacillus sp. FJAT-45037]
MDGKKGTKKDTNVIPYPGLVKRLIEKGMDALKAKDATSAYNHFLTAEQYEPDHPQVRFGKVLSLIELGQLKEAVIHTSALLNEGIGDYYDNLQVHISLLVQLGEYQEVVDILEAVLSENNLPAQSAESFYQLLHFSRQMIDDSALLATIEESVEESEHETKSPLIEVENQLKQGTIKEQWQALSYLKERELDDTIAPLINYIEGETNDWLLRSYALEILHSKQCEDLVHITKASQTTTIIPKELLEITEQPFSIQLKEELSQQLAHVDPLLAQMAEQIGYLHLFAWYPFIPEPDSVTLWAAVYHYLASERIGGEGHLDEVADLYQCDEELVKEKVTEVTLLEEKVFEAYTQFSN